MCVVSLSHKHWVVIAKNPSEVAPRSVLRVLNSRFHGSYDGLKTTKPTLQRKGEPRFNKLHCHLRHDLLITDFI